MATKLKDTPTKKVIISLRDPNNEADSGFVGGNNIVVNGVRTIKHFRFKLGEEIELPEPFVEQLKARAYVGRDRKGDTVRIPTYIVEEV